MEKAATTATSAHTLTNMDAREQTRDVIKKKGSGFWDRIAKRYARSPIADEASYQKKLEITREHFQPDMTVLEIGCGTGSTALLHAPFVQHIHATDISGKMLDIAREKAETQNIHNVKFQQLAVSELNMPDNTFDVIMGMSILHLLENKEAAMANAFRMLKPGGVFISSTACLADSQKYFKPIAVVGHFLRLLPLVNIFTTKELEQSLQQAGFAIDYQWTPGKGKSVFMVAKKPE